MQSLLTANKANMRQLSRTFGMSRSGLYSARQRSLAPKAPLCAQALSLQAIFAASGAIYGSRRLRAALERQGIAIGRYKVRTLMRRHGLRARWKRKFTHTTDSKHQLPISENVLNRQFQPEQANRAWVGDITHVRTVSGWLYLAVILDLFSRKVVGWAMMAPHMQSTLVCDALRMAIGARQPQPGLLMHTDRGSQYASQAHTELLGAYGLEQSMSRKGNCWDNAVCERFFLNLKMERVWQGQYANHAEAQRDIADYIVNFYNAQRLHSTLGYVPPNEFEQLRTTTFPQTH